MTAEAPDLGELSARSGRGSSPLWCCRCWARTRSTGWCRPWFVPLLHTSVRDDIAPAHPDASPRRARDPGGRQAIQQASPLPVDDTVATLTALLS